jgi:hypothetical protein
MENPRMGTTGNMEKGKNQNKMEKWVEKDGV